MQRIPNSIEHFLVTSDKLQWTQFLILILFGGQKNDISLHSSHPKGSLLCVNWSIRSSQDANLLSSY
jgi:hypothetical protein